MSNENNKTSQLITSISSMFKRHRFLTVLVGLLLVLINLLLLIQIRPLFKPIQVIFDVVAVPIIFAALFYYLFKPVSEWLQKRGLSRFMSVVIVFIIIIAVLTILIFSIFPFITEQIAIFVTDFPNMWNTFISSSNNFLSEYGLDQYQDVINEQLLKITQSFSENFQNYISQASTIISNAIGSVVNIAISVVTAPIMLYYMLKEGDKLKPSLIQLVPIKARPIISSFLSDANKKLSLYINGQIIVAICVGFMFLIGYAIIDLPYGSVLALLAGVLNIVPYLGTFVAMIPAFIIAIVESPMMVIYVIIVFTIEQTIEGRILSPKILGNNLDIHPITILIVLLVSGRLLGFTGIIIGVPLYSILKLAVQYIHTFLKEKTDLY